jgi:L-ascorbate metabolism protein UlaG (beta-lactamase superfamily)
LIKLGPGGQLIGSLCTSTRQSPILEYLLNPDLPILPAKADRWRGNPIRGNEFQYLQEAFRPDWGALLRMMVSPNPQRKEKKADTWVPPVHTDLNYLEDRRRNWVTWLGHACFLVQLNGVRLLIDPQLRDMPLVPRRVPSPVAVEAIRGVDYLLLSHDHRDHVDERCVRTLVRNNPIKKILCPLKLSNVIHSWVGDTMMEEAAWYQVYDTLADDVRITFLPTRHWCRRGLTDFNRVLWGSFMLEALESEGRGAAGAMLTSTAKHTIYFAGDSAQTTYWEEVGGLFQGIDLALMGIGAYKPTYMMQDNHANPEEAFSGFRALGAKHWWPMHHGTYDLSNEPASEPIRWATRLMEEAGMRDRLVQPPLGAPHWL